MNVVVRCIKALGAWVSIYSYTVDHGMVSVYVIMLNECRESEKNLLYFFGRVSKECRSPKIAVGQNPRFERWAGAPQEHLLFHKNLNYG